MKAKNLFALERFMGRTAGFMGKSDDKTLEALGIGDVLLSHQHRSLDCSWAKASQTCLLYLAKISTCSMKLRLSCDFLFRYWEKGFGQLQQEIRFSATWCLWDFKLVPLGFQVPYLGRITRQHREDMAQQKFKSILIMADASPKGKLHVSRTKHIGPKGSPSMT